MKNGPNRRNVLLGSRVYWACQVLGWGGYMAESVVSDLLWGRWEAQTVSGTLCIGGSGLVVSHLCRVGLRLGGWTKRGPLGRLPGRALGASAAMAGVWLGVTWTAMRLSGALDTGELTPWRWAMVCLYALLLSAGWNAIYFAYHAGRRLLDAQRQAQVAGWRWQAALSEAQFQTLKAQVHPHFLFNALTGLRALIKEDPTRAREAVTRLSNLLRYSLRTGQVTTVTLAEELEVVDDYLGLEAMRLEGRLRVRREVDPAALGRAVPPMAVQSLVENAVKHGVAPLLRPPEITLTVCLPEGGGPLRVEVTNGAAAPPDADDPGGPGQEPERSGFGLVNLRERLTRLHGPGAAVTLAPPGPLHPGRFTATMCIPAPVGDAPPRPIPSPTGPGWAEEVLAWPQP